MADNDSGDSGLVMFFLGGVIGGALGLLLAPRKGEETRELLNAWLEENRKKTEKFLEEERQVLNGKKDQLAAAWEARKKACDKPNGKPNSSN